MIKIILGTLIEKWDMELADPNANRHFCWRTFYYTVLSTKVCLEATKGRETVSSIMEHMEYMILYVVSSALRYNHGLRDNIRSDRFATLV